MATGLLGARLILAIVFAISGTAKLADVPGSRTAMREFGLPASLAPTLGLLLPIAEIATAIALLPLATAWWGALVAVTLLGVFTVAIAFNLARGRRPDCHCFGRLRSEPIGWRTIARNAVLAGLAGLLLWEAPDRVGSSAVAWFGMLSGVEIGLLVLSLIALTTVSAQGWVLAQLVAQNGRVITRLDALEARLAGTSGARAPRPAGLPVGAHPPTVALPDLVGHRVDVTKPHGRPTLVLFWHPECGFCQRMLPQLKAWEDSPRADATRLVLVSGGTVEANRAMVLKAPVLLDPDFAAGPAFGVTGTPSCVLLDAEGRVAAPVAVGAKEVMGLANR